MQKMREILRNPLALLGEITNGGAAQRRAVAFAQKSCPARQNSRIKSHVYCLNCCKFTQNCAPAGRACIVRENSIEEGKCEKESVL